MLKDHQELLSALNAHNVKYLVVGGHAVGVHSEPRGTKDLDIFIKADPQNAAAVFEALLEFGAPLQDVSPADFANDADTIYQIGQPPSRVDILQSLPGITFDQAWQNRIPASFGPDIPVNIISQPDLIQNKTAVGRPQDLIDIEKMKAAKQTRK